MSRRSLRSWCGAWRCAARAGLALSLLAGCSSSGAAPVTDHRPEGGGTMNSSSGGAVAEARRLLAARLGVDEGAIQVVKVAEVVWPDTSLGCPQPGMAYAQRLVNGSQIVLQAEGRRFHYHSGAGRGPFYCEHPQPPAEAGGYGDV